MFTFIGKGPGSKNIMLRLCLAILLFCLLSTLSQQSFRQKGFAHTLASYTISGTVFDDYNQNGVQDSREPGMNGIVVTAYNASEAVAATATTAEAGGILGQYTLAIADGTGPVRVQFNNFGATSTLPELVGFQPSRHDSGTTVAFVDGTQATNTVSLGIERPGEYCQNNPDMATSCYVRGDQTNAATHVMVRFPYNSTGTAATNPPVPLANAPQVGATWGLAYRRSTDDLFAAAYTKQIVGYKPGGSTGAIYRIHAADSASPTVDPDPFVDLNTLFGANTAGANPHTSTNNYVPDLSAYDAVGKIALGGLALSEDDSTLYAMNLANRSLYSIPLGAPSAAPVTPTAAAITQQVVPTPTDCTASDVRPFAVTSYRNLIYVGAVCSAESTITPATPEGDARHLKAYIFAYTPDSGFNATPVFEAPLNYPRHCADRAFNFASTCVIRGYHALWNAWQPNAKKAYRRTVYPQPMLTSIAFDNGDLILGLRDRYGDQTGYKISGLPEARSGGDVVRACLNTAGDLSSGWTLEHNGTCGAITIVAGQNSGKGPGNGQYYYKQYYVPYHDYTSLGGVAQIPGAPDVMSITFDPGQTIDTGGVRTYSNTTGAETNNYEFYQNTVGTFGKTNGLGDLVAFCQSAPTEIGDRIWVDSNGNGLQDATEPPLANVTVHLYAADSTTLLQTTTTDANGNYYFTISPYTRYVIKLDNASDYTTGPLKGYQLTSANQKNDHQGIDSQAVLPVPETALGTNNFPQISVSAHTPGQNDYSLDAGFVNAPNLSIVKTHDGPANMLVGQNVNYTLTVSNGFTAGPVLNNQPITVTDTPPAGLSNITAQGTNWTITTSAASNSQTFTAKYTGPYPVLGGTTLEPITIKGTLTSTATPQIVNVAVVTTPSDSDNSDNTAKDSIGVQEPPQSLVHVSIKTTHSAKTLRAGTENRCFANGQDISYQIVVHTSPTSGTIAPAVPITILDTLPADVSHITAKGKNWSVTLTKQKNATHVTAIYNGLHAITPGSPLPPLTVTGTLNKHAGHAITSVTTVKVLGESTTKHNTTTNEISICRNPNPGLPPTGSDPFAH